ncbi:MAG: hypothetical protein M5T52_14620 [Ignavibacteriaceae bacterium]|nr:hypothetical protein [Ignavibacteriaceae bacterium]
MVMLFNFKILPQSSFGLAGYWGLQESLSIPFTIMKAIHQIISGLKIGEFPYNTVLSLPKKLYRQLTPMI